MIVIMVVMIILVMMFDMMIVRIVVTVVPPAITPVAMIKIDHHIRLAITVAMPPMTISLHNGAAPLLVQE